MSIKYHSYLILNHGKKDIPKSENAHALREEVFCCEPRRSRYNVRLFPFQETQQEPEEIHCIVRTDEDGKVSIVQNVQYYLEKNYPLSEKSNYDFVVRRAYPDKNTMK